MLGQQGGKLEILGPTHYVATFDFGNRPGRWLTGSTMVSISWPQDLYFETHGAWMLEVHDGTPLKACI